MIFVRAMTAADRPFVFGTWLASYQQALDVRGVRPDTYKAGMTARIAALLARGRTVVAVETAAPTAGLGWCCSEGDTVHFVYVKRDARRHGVATAMLPPEARAYSHRTYLVQHLRRAATMQFDPFAIEGAHVRDS